MLLAYQLVRKVILSVAILTQQELYVLEEVSILANRHCIYHEEREIDSNVSQFQNTSR